MITNHPLQHRPVERFIGDVCLAVDAYSFPAGAALAEYVYRIGSGVDDLADPTADVGEHGHFQGGDEDAALDAVTVGLQDSGEVS